MTMSQGFLSSVDSTTTGLEEIRDQGEDIMRTELSPTDAAMQTANTLVVSLQNDGQTKLNSFNKWDIIVQYFDSSGTYYVKWLPYTEGTLGDNEWKKAGIFLNGDPEAFESNIVNPGEEVRIQAKLNPAVGPGTTNLVVVSTPSGVPASTAFIY